MNSKFLLFILSRGLIIGGVFMIIISLVLLNLGLEKKNITENNKIIAVAVFDSPLDCEKVGNRKATFKFKHNNKIYTKKASKLTCEAIIGKNEVNLLTNKEENKLLFLNEYKESNDFYSAAIFALFGILIAYKGWKK